MPNHFKIGLLFAACAFLTYSIYWTKFSVFWVYRLTANLIPLMGTLNLSRLHRNIIIVQEYAASFGYFLVLIGAVFAAVSTIQFLKGQDYRINLGRTLFFEAAFFLMLFPSSIHHLLGVALSWTFVDFLVGISFLLQVCLIVPPLIIVGHNLGKTRKQILLQKWVAIGAPLVVWAFWFKYLFLWLDTLLPLGPKQADLAVVMGGVNSVVTFLVAGIFSALAGFAFYRQRKINTRLVGAALIMIGGYFAIYDLVSLWVSVYNYFLYLTDFWMITLLILGVAVVKVKSYDIEH